MVDENGRLLKPTSLSNDYPTCHPKSPYRPTGHPIHPGQGWYLGCLAWPTILLGRPPLHTGLGHTCLVADWNFSISGLFQWRGGGASRGAEVPSGNNISHTLSLPPFCFLGGGVAKSVLRVHPLWKPEKANKWKCLASNSICQACTWQKAVWSRKHLIKNISWKCSWPIQLISPDILTSDGNTSGCRAL